jgi:hypothetical protein
MEFTVLPVLLAEVLEDLALHRGVARHLSLADEGRAVRLGDLDQDRATVLDAFGFPQGLLMVGDVGLEHSNGARDQQYDDTQRNENLHDSE